VGLDCSSLGSAARGPLCCEAMADDVSSDAASAVASDDTNPAVSFRVARREDLEGILTLLANDDVARARTGYAEAVTPELLAAFDEIAIDGNNELLVGELAGADDGCSPPRRASLLLAARLRGEPPGDEARALRLLGRRL
jgi:hypothetical protein